MHVSSGTVDQAGYCNVTRQHHGWDWISHVCQYVYVWVEHWLSCGNTSCWFVFHQKINKSSCWPFVDCWTST